MEKTSNHSKTTIKNYHKKQITLIYFAAKQRYGSPRIRLELEYLGYKVSRPESLLEQAKQLQWQNI